MSKQKKSGNTAKAVQEVKTAAGEKNTIGLQNAVGPESDRINQRFGRITSTLMTIYVLFYLCIFPLATHDKYFDILDFRFKLYWIPTFIYGIFFLNFHLKGFEQRTVRTVQLKVEETGELFSDRLKVFTLELPNYRKMKEEDCKTRIDYWLYNITNLETMTTNIPFQQQQPAFKKVGNIAELVRMTPEELKQYNISIDSYRTNLSIMKNKRAKGIAEGSAKGKAEEKEKAIEEYRLFGG